MQSRKFNIPRDPYRDKEYLYAKRNITINEGVTILVGANGIGKTSLISFLEDELKQLNIPTIKFDNLHDGGHNARSKAGFLGQTDFLCQSFCSSEGENIKLNIERFAPNVGNFVLKKNKDAKEIWVFFDAIDSGLSIDKIIWFKEFFDIILENKKSDQAIYIVCSANSYEMAFGQNCYDVQGSQYREFKSYQAYKNFILRTSKKRDLAEQKYLESRG